MDRVDKELWKYEYWFASIKKVKNKTKRILRENVQSAKDIYYIEAVSYTHLLVILLEKSKKKMNMTEIQEPFIKK